MDRHNSAMTLSTDLTGLGFRPDPTVAEPIYVQLAAVLSDAIRAGRIAVGARLPSERLYAKVLGISRTTLSRWEVEGRVRPVYGKRVTPGAGFSLYRREDIERLKSPESDRPMHTARAA